MPKSTIYTKKGDAGMSCLSDLKSRKKSEIAFEGLGQLDELNTRIGFAAHALKSALPNETAMYDMIISIQHTLMKISSILAMPKDANEPLEDYAQKMIQKKLVLEDNLTPWLEKLIDGIDARCSPLKNFILPGGSLPACHLHSCRTQCRSAERMIARYDTIYPIILIGNTSIFTFINRLSDLFFVMARYANQQLGVEDVPHISNS